MIREKIAREKTAKFKVQNPVLKKTSKGWKYCSIVIYTIRVSFGFIHISLTSKASYTWAHNKRRIYEEAIVWLKANNSWLLRNANQKTIIDDHFDLFGESARYCSILIESQHQRSKIKDPRVVNTVHISIHNPFIQFIQITAMCMKEYNLYIQLMI